MHVPGEGELEELRRARHAVGQRLELPLADGGHRGSAGGRAAARTAAGVAVHRAVDDDGLAHPGFDRTDPETHERLDAGTAARAVHMEVRADAEVSGDNRGRRRIIAVVAEEPVDVLRSEARVSHRP